MRKLVLVFFVFFIVFLGCPLPAQAVNLTYASDHYVYANDLVNKGEYEKALEEYMIARSMDERFYNEHYGITYQIGWVLNKLGRYDEALSEFKIAEKYQPEKIAKFAIYYNEGCVLARLGRNEEALKAFDAALLYSPSNWLILFNKGLVLSRMGKYAEAVSTFDTSRKAYGSYLPLLGSYQEAAATYGAADGSIVSLPNTPVPTGIGSPRSIAFDAYDAEMSTDQLMRTGMDFVARYQYENALVVFDRVLKIDPSHYKAMSWKGCALANMGRYAEAENIFETSFQYMDYRRHAVFYQDSLYGKAWALAQQGKYDQALSMYARLFVQDPDHFRAHHDRAWVLSKQGHFDDAVKEYNRSLEWENQYSLEVQSYTILGPLGTYRDVMDAYDKTKSTQSFLSELSAQPSHNVVIYQTDFSTDPGWRTSLPRLYYWDPVNKSYHFMSQSSLGFAEIDVPYNGTPFQLEFDITIPHADPGTLVRFGISQYNTSEDSQKRMVRYNSQNVIMGEFKSWLATTYRSIKDGDKTIQVYAIDRMKYASDPEYEGMCRINREESIAIPSFGETRIYHVFIESDPEKETIAIKVTDNLHEKTFYVCHWMFSKTGTFENMGRLILVAEPAENAYIEGSIDNIVLSVPAEPSPATAPAVTTPVRVATPERIPAAPLTTVPVTTAERISPAPSAPVNGTLLPAALLPGILTTPAALVPVLLLIIGVIALFVAADYLNRRGRK